jgi:hypothetical protein
MKGCHHDNCHHPPRRHLEQRRCGRPAAAAGARPARAGQRALAAKRPAHLSGGLLPPVRPDLPPQGAQPRVHRDGRQRGQPVPGPRRRRALQQRAALRRLCRGDGHAHLHGGHGWRTSPPPAQADAPRLLPRGHRRPHGQGGGAGPSGDGALVAGQTDPAAAPAADPGGGAVGRRHRGPRAGRGFRRHRPLPQHQHARHCPAHCAAAHAADALVQAEQGARGRGGRRGARLAPGPPAGGSPRRPGGRHAGRAHRRGRTLRPGHAARLGGGAVLRRHRHGGQHADLHGLCAGEAS